MITLEQTNDAMRELIQPGIANGKVAYWNACLSIRNDLGRNCNQAGIMRSYANRPLPINRAELRAELCNPMERTVNTLYEIEALWNEGTIHFHRGSTFESQSAWRLDMCAAIPGMSMKTVSFALHIFDPFNCMLLSIDCWHQRRISEERDLKPAVYLLAEEQTYFDIARLATDEGMGYSPIVYAACLWLRYRYEHSTKANRSKNAMPEDGCQSHAGLTCYV